MPQKSGNSLTKEGKMEEISLKTISENSESILELKGNKANEYVRFLKALAWHFREAKPALVEDLMEGFLNNAFRKIFGSFIANIGLSPERVFDDCGGFITRLKSEYETTIDFYGDGFKIIPGRKDCLDGFKPELTFFIDLNTPTEIRVSFSLSLMGPAVIEGLIEPTFLYYLNHNKKRPSVHSSGGKILFAPVTQVREFLENMKQLVAFVGEKINKFGKVSLPDQIDVGKAFRAQTILETLGIKL